MGLIFLAFANDAINPLPTLSQESSEVHRSLSNRFKKGHFDILREEHVSLAKLAEQLIKFRSEITVFHYAGHAERDALLMEDGTTSALGIAGLLGQCPNLKLIILNGCSTQGQVAELLKLPNHPVVIATSAPVDDYAAAQFSISFFQAFSEAYQTIRQSFELGVAAAQGKRMQPIDVQSRNFGRQSTEPALGTWGIFFQDGYEILTEWRMPGSSSIHNSADFVPNSTLLFNLTETLAPYNEKINALFEAEENGEEIDVIDKRQAILEAMPHPISEHLRKLLVKEHLPTGQTFYDKLGKDRFIQLAATYKSLIEWPAYVLMAQLWDQLIVKHDQIDLTSEQNKLLRAYISLPIRDRIKTHFFTLVPTLVNILNQNGSPVFIEELNDILEDFEEHSNLRKAAHFFEQNNVSEHISDELASDLCIEGEEQLAYILGKFGFFARYTLISVKNVRVNKHRYEDTPKFNHRLVELIQRFVGLKSSYYESGEILDNSSVHLRKGKNGTYKYLNLSPFIIDENAFDDAAQIAKLYFFDRYVDASDLCAFRHIYKPMDNPLLIKPNMSARTDKNWRLKVFHTQYSKFSRLFH